MENQNAKLKLAEVLERREHEKAAAVTEQRERQAATEREMVQRQAAKARWGVSKGEIEAAVKAVNEQVADTGWVLSISEKPVGADDRKLAQLFINLAEEGDSRTRKLVLNVSDIGRVRPVSLIPHSGANVADFEIQAVGKDHYEEIIVAFLGMCSMVKIKP